MKRLHPHLQLGGAGTEGDLAHTAALDSVRREIAVLKGFRHDNIVRLLGYTPRDAGEEVCLVYEICEGGALSSALQVSVCVRTV